MDRLASILPGLWNDKTSPMPKIIKEWAKKCAYSSLQILVEAFN